MLEVLLLHFNQLKLFEMRLSEKHSINESVNFKNALTGIFFEEN